MRSGVIYWYPPRGVWCWLHWLYEGATILIKVRHIYVIYGWVYSSSAVIRLAFVSRALISLSADAWSVAPCRGLGLAFSPVRRRLRTSTFVGTPRCARCTRSCVQPLIFGWPGRTFPWGLVAVPVRLRAAVSQIPSSAAAFFGGAIGGGTATASSRRVVVRACIKSP
jgi:hypothetical protein